MVKLRWWLLIALIAGIVLGPIIAGIQGFVLIGAGHWTVEMRLSLAVALVCVLVMFLIVLGSLIGPASSLHSHIRNVVRGFRQRQGRAQLQEGLRALASGEWEQAEKLSLQAADKTEFKVVCFLAAAMAAQERADIEKRDRYLSQAHRADPNADLAVGLTEARLHLRSRHYKQARDVLSQLDRIAPRHTPVMKLLQHVLRKQGDLLALEQLLPRLRKYQALPEAQLTELDAQVLQYKLEQAGSDLAEIRQLWRQTPKPARRDINSFIAYGRALIRARVPHEAERLTRKFLEQVWDKRLVLFYGEIETYETQRQLQTAERWTEKRNADAPMLTTLAKLSMRAQQWVKAQQYLNELVRMQPSTATWILLADVYEQLRDPDQMKACISEALKQAHADPVLNA